MSFEDFSNKLNAIVICNSVEDILASDILDSVQDYSMIMQNLLDTELKAQFAVNMMNNGHTNIVVENIGALDINENIKIGKENQEFMQIFLENFEQSLENTNEVYEYTLEDLGSTQIPSKENDGEVLSGKDIIHSNWKALTEKSSAISRSKLFHILNTTTEGKQIIQDELPTLFYSDSSHMYNFLMRNILNDKIVSKEQMANLILANPTRMVSDSFDVKEEYMFDADNFMDLLGQIDEILETTPNLDPTKIQGARSNIEEYIAQNFEQLLERLKAKEEKNEREGYSIKDLKALKFLNTDKHLIDEELAKNYEEISSNTQKEDIMDVLHLFSDVGVEEKNIDIETAMKQTFSAITDEDLQWAISRMATELLQDQNASLKDMEIFGKGHYSRSMKIGEYIFKVGEDRSTSEIPYDERIIQPLTRRKLEGTKGEEVYVEVQNLVDKDWYKGLSDEEVDEELYKIYSEMRDRGHRWTDVRKDNVGRLLKPNTPEFDINGNRIQPEDSAIGFTGNSNERRVLPAGELVIIDTDFIFEQDQKYSGSIASAHKRFEARYLKEVMERENQETPKLLSSTIEASKEQISNKDIQGMSQSVIASQKGQEKEEKTEEYFK